MTIIKISECEVIEHPFFVMKGGAFWCLHCERISKAIDWKNNDFECPYDGCDGDGLDMTPRNHDFEEGKIYPMYGE